MQRLAWRSDFITVAAASPFSRLLPTMAAAETSFGHGGLPLESFNRSVPPGWRPYQPHYPYRRYLERLRLWYRQTDLGVGQLGPAVAARLQGRPFNLAMALQVMTQQGTLLRGDAALGYEGEDAVLGGGGNIIVQATEYGLQQLLRELTRRYGADEQQTVGAAIDTFLDLRRGRMSLLEYIAEHDYTFGEALSLGGLQVNDVGRSHLLLKHSGLEPSKQEHLRLLIGQDLNRYDELKGHMERMAKSTMPTQAPGPLGYTPPHG